jgi:hypothetical protein
MVLHPGPEEGELLVAPVVLPLFVDAGWAWKGFLFLGLKLGSCWSSQDLEGF